jgi:hypothetical protein
VEALRVTPCQREEADQLHVVTARSNRRVARYDCGSGRIEVEDEYYRDAALEALSPHLTRTRPTSPRVPDEPGPEPAGTTERPDTADAPPAPSTARGAGTRRAAERTAPRSEPSAASTAARTAVRHAREAAAQLTEAWRRQRTAPPPAANEVAARLARLSKHDWYVLDAPPPAEEIPEGHIDHLLVGPRGVFTVHARHHPDGRVGVYGDTLIIDGRRPGYIPACRAEAERVERLLTAARGLPVHVTPVLAISGTANLRVSSAPPDVLVVQANGIDKALKRRPVVFNTGTVTRVYRLTRTERVWLAGG